VIKELVINYKPNSPHQERFHESEAFEKALIAGFGSGKTIAGAAEFIKLCSINAGLESMMVSPSYPMANRTILPTFKTMLESSNIDFTYNEQKHIFYIPDFRHTTYVGSADIPASLKGSNLSHLWMDEPSVCSLDAYTQSIARVRVAAAPKLSILHTFTPETMTWCYDEFIINQRSDREVVFGRTIDNPELAKDYVENLKSRYSEEMQKMYLEGQFVFATDKMVIPEWRPDFIQELERQPEYKFYQHYVSCDWGLGDKTAIVYATWDFLRSVLYVEKVQTLTNRDAVTSNIATLIKATSHDLWQESKLVRYVGDSNNGQIIQDLNIIYNLPFVGTTKSNMSDDPQRIGIKQSMVNALREQVKQGKVIIDPSCLEMIGNLRSGIWNKNYSSFERSEQYGHFDLLDALIYLNRNIDRASNPIPETFYWDKQKSQIKTKAHVSPLAGALGLKRKIAVEKF
jgi:PBSX family phage terminase large subunit